MGALKNLMIEQEDKVIEEVLQGKPVLTGVHIYRQWRVRGAVPGKTELVAVAPIHLRDEVSVAVSAKNAAIAEAYPEATAHWVYYIDTACTHAFLTAEAIQL